MYSESVSINLSVRAASILGELTKVLVGDRSEYVEITFWLLEKNY